MINDQNILFMSIFTIWGNLIQTMIEKERLSYCSQNRSSCDEEKWLKIILAHFQKYQPTLILYIRILLAPGKGKIGETKCEIPQLLFRSPSSLKVVKKKFFFLMIKKRTLHQLNVETARGHLGSSNPLNQFLQL